MPHGVHAVLLAFTRASYASSCDAYVTQTQNLHWGELWQQSSGPG